MKKTALLLTVSLLSLSFTLPAQTESNNQKTWSMQNHGVYFSLTHILPDQARAFYSSRGFTLPQIEKYATSCLFMALLRNDNTTHKIHFTRQNWSASVAGKSHSLPSITQWMDALTSSNAAKPALIAFRWAQFPNEQEYQPNGDWNQGMLSVGLPAKSPFDLTVRWQSDGKKDQLTLKGITCAE